MLFRQIVLVMIIDLAASGCLTLDSNEAQFSLRIANAVPEGTVGYRFSAYQGASCVNSRAADGSLSDDLANEYVPLRESRLFPMKVGSYTFEALAVDSDRDDAKTLASGCAKGVIRQDQTTPIMITLTPVPVSGGVHP